MRKEIYRLTLSQAPAFCKHSYIIPIMQLPPGKDVDAAFVSIAKAFYKTYEEKVAAYTDACRNY